VATFSSKHNHECIKSISTDERLEYHSSDFDNILLKGTQGNLINYISIVKMNVLNVPHPYTALEQILGLNGFFCNLKKIIICLNEKDYFWR